MNLSWHFANAFCPVSPGGYSSLITDWLSVWCQTWEKDSAVSHVKERLFILTCNVWCPCLGKLAITLSANLKMRHWLSSQVNSSVFSVTNLLRWWLPLKRLFFSARSFFVALLFSIFTSFSTLCPDAVAPLHFCLAFPRAWPHVEEAQISGRWLKMGSENGKY